MCLEVSKIAKSDSVVNSGSRSRKRMSLQLRGWVNYRINHELDNLIVSFFPYLWQLWIFCCSLCPEGEFREFLLYFRISQVVSTVWLSEEMGLTSHCLYQCISVVCLRAHCFTTSASIAEMTGTIRLQAKKPIVKMILVIRLQISWSHRYWFLHVM